MEIKLNRKVKIEKYYIVGEIGFAEKREEIISYLLVAQQYNGQLRAEDICRDLLHDPNLLIGNRIIKICQFYGLINDNQYLTSAGYEAIRNKAVLVPEEGVYEIITTNDPFFPEVIIGLERSENKDFFAELRETREKFDENKKSSENQDKDIKKKISILSELPAYIDQLIGKTLDLQDKQIKIFSIHRNCQKATLGRKDELYLTLTLSEHKEYEKQFSGLISKTLVTKEINDNFNTLFKMLLKTDANNWDIRNSNYVYHINFDFLKEHELNTFYKDITIQNPELSSYGSFNSTVVKDVPITPKTNTDAQKWIEYLVWNDIKDYLSDQDYIRIWNKYLTQFNGYSINKLSKEQLLDKKMTDNNNKPNQFWYIKVPELLTEEGL